MLAKLRQDNEELGHIAEDLPTRLSASELRDVEGLARCRWRLTRGLTQRLAVEDTHVYPKLAHDPRPRIFALASRMKSDLVDVTSHFHSYCESWAMNAVVADWDGYRRAAYAMIDLLRRRIDLEDRHLYSELAVTDGVHRP
ncbi:MAG: hemerythrin domain-containing protein [Sphingomonadaceae bacterium]|nr:hemerythrin domain-containing protein [Sphingomonadaceae bacterium]